MHALALAVPVSLLCPIVRVLKRHQPLHLMGPVDALKQLFTSLWCIVSIRMRCDSRNIYVTPLEIEAEANDGLSHPASALFQDYRKVFTAACESHKLCTQLSARSTASL